VLCVGNCGCVEYWACMMVMLNGSSPTVVQGGAVILVAELVAEGLVGQHVADSASTHAWSLLITNWLSRSIQWVVGVVEQLIQFIVQHVMPDHWKVGGGSVWLLVVMKNCISISGGVKCCRSCWKLADWHWKFFVVHTVL